jgi:hypothetical protein
MTTNRVMEIVIGIGSKPAEPTAAAGAVREQPYTAMSYGVSDQNQCRGD